MTTAVVLVASLQGGTLRGHVVALPVELAVLPLALARPLRSQVVSCLGTLRWQAQAARMVVWDARPRKVAPAFVLCLLFVGSPDFMCWVFLTRRAALS